MTNTIHFTALLEQRLARFVPQADYEVGSVLLAVNITARRPS